VLPVLEVAGSVRPGDPVALSRRLAHALRHDPAAYGLALDPQGWAPVPDLLAGLSRGGRRVTEDDLAAALALPGKRRYERDGDRIRARYGHSVAARVEVPAAVPPDVLFHGTTADAVAAIRERGLLPMRRQHVHLSADPATARAVGARRRRAFVVLEVAAAEAHAAGVTFRDAGLGIWLADPVPPAYVRLPDPA
jgi:putative RNA 2'-phosphotransferase